MPQPTGNSKLERVTHICLIAVCLVALGMLLERRFVPKAASPSMEATEKALIGKHIAAPGRDWKTSQVNAVLYMSTNCHFCQESTSFYREITDVKRPRRQGVSLSVLSQESPEMMKEYLAKEHIGIDGVYKLPPSIAGLMGTPTWLILDSDGTIRRVFIGKLDASREKELLKVLNAGTV
jgi:hypothetical protein